MAFPAVTIAIRYCTVRRQGGEPERQVISYPSVYIRLAPALSQAYVFMVLGRLMVSRLRGYSFPLVLTSASDQNELFGSMAGRLAVSDTSMLAETHAISSGLKSYVTRRAVDAVGVCRAALGGHGYSGFSGIGRLQGTMMAGKLYACLLIDLPRDQQSPLPRHDL